MVTDTVIVNFAVSDMIWVKCVFNSFIVLVCTLLCFKVGISVRVRLEVRTKFTVIVLAREKCDVKP